MLNQLLADFLFRLTFGIAVAMAGISSRDVTSGFFRVHLWILLGLQTLAVLAVFPGGLAFPNALSLQYGLQYGQLWLALLAAVVSYVGAVLWLYERKLAGKFAIHVVANCALVAALLPTLKIVPSSVWFLSVLDRITSGRLIGFAVTSMLLGHWYLNTPTMKLAPLKRLLFWLAVAVFLRMGVCAIGVQIRCFGSDANPSDTWYIFLALRWLSGLIGVLVLTILAWQTLKIPNTQSATGILYATTVLAFIGELMSQLLSAGALYPV